MTASPYDALDRLRSMAATGELSALCVRHDLDLLVVHGSAVDAEPLRPARDLDLAFLTRPDAKTDVVELTNDLLDATRFDGLDLMDLQRAGPVARARALSPDCLVLYESSPGLFANAQIAAITIEMETQWLRRLSLQLMAER